MIDVIISQLISQAAENMPAEGKAMLKRVDEFLPLIKSYNDGVPQISEKNEIGLAYVIRFEQDKKDKEKTAIVLYQVMLAAKEGVNGGKPTFSRSLNRWDITEKLKEITGQ